MCLELSGPAVWQVVQKHTHPKGTSQSGHTQSVTHKVLMYLRAMPMDAYRSAAAMLIQAMMTRIAAGTMSKAVGCAMTTAAGWKVMPLVVIQPPVQ